YFCNTYDLLPFLHLLPPGNQSLYDGVEPAWCGWCVTAKQPAPARPNELYRQICTYQSDTQHTTRRQYTDSLCRALRHLQLGALLSCTHVYCTAPERKSAI